MEGTIILNGSPRAKISNSKEYAEMFMKNCNHRTEYINITKTNHHDIISQIGDYSHMLLVFPLYADGIPVTLLNFLKCLENNPPLNKPIISMIINCGFLESRQNDTAVEMIRLFCRKNNYTFGSALKIGSGEAILDTPFRFLVSRKIRQLAFAVENNKNQILKTTMPLTRKMFVKAANNYWIKYGEKNNITKEQMKTMKIE